jgi:PHD/YefM family antitoxin component YafN of YafNO toxin-antitoxin module
MLHCFARNGNHAPAHYTESTKAAFDKLATDGKAVITNNGRPQAILVKVDAASFENTLSLLQKLEFMQNLTEMRLTSRRNSNSDMTLGEINAEIAAARAERTKKNRR